MISPFEKIANQLSPLPERAYLAGGCVRDALLGRPPRDLDVAVAGDPAAAARALAHALGGRLVALGRGAETLHRIVRPRGPTVDIVALWGKDIFGDLRRRDFTINAMAWDVGEKRLIDPAGGREDLNRGRIRTTGPEAFARDPVRMVRALRFAAALGFRLTRETRAALASRAPDLAAAPGERIREELHKLMETGRAGPFLATMAETGLLSALLPNAGPPDLSILAKLDADLRRPATRPPETARALRNTGPTDRLALRYAALLRGWGAESARKRLETLSERLRWSRRETDRVRRLLEGIRNAETIIPAEWPRNSAPETISPEAARWFRSLGPSPASPLLLLRALGPEQEPGPSEAAAERLLGFERRVLSPRRRAGPLLDGRDLTSELGLPPSPRIGELLETVEIERLAGRLRTRDQALDRIRSILHRPFPDSPS